MLVTRKYRLSDENSDGIITLNIESDTADGEVVQYADVVTDYVVDPLYEQANMVHLVGRISQKIELPGEISVIEILIEFSRVSKREVRKTAVQVLSKALDDALVQEAIDSNCLVHIVGKIKTINNIILVVPTEFKPMPHFKELAYGTITNSVVFRTMFNRVAVSGTMGIQTSECNKDGKMVYRFKFKPCHCDNWINTYVINPTKEQVALLESGEDVHITGGLVSYISDKKSEAVYVYQLKIYDITKVEEQE